MRLLGTSVYGIRRYKAGSWLATHLDRIDTHVISVIINVAQAGVKAGGGLLAAGGMLQEFDMLGWLVTLKKFFLLKNQMYNNDNASSKII